MKSIFEYFLYAAQYEQRAAATVDPVSRTWLLNTAEHWRARGRAAQAKVDGERRDTGQQAPGGPVFSVPDAPRKPKRKQRRRKSGLAHSLKTPRA